MFFRYHYLAAGKAIVHGVDKENIILPDDNYGCRIIKTNTILRKSVIEIKTSSKKFIVAILGGGSNNASENFKNSTIEIGNRIIQAAAILQDEKFRIYCNDKYIADALYRLGLTNNIEIIYEYTSPEVIYSSAKTVLCRAGRNTISEIMFLGIPSILISSSGDFRSADKTSLFVMSKLIC